MCGAGPLQSLGPALHSKHYHRTIRGSSFPVFNTLENMSLQSPPKLALTCREYSAACWFSAASSGHRVYRQHKVTHIKETKLCGKVTFTLCLVQLLILLAIIIITHLIDIVLFQIFKVALRTTNKDVLSVSTPTDYK